MHHNRTSLRLVTTPPSDDYWEPDEAWFRSRVVLARPGDRLEPWPLRDEIRVDEFVRACKQAGVRFGIAARTVIERSLIVEVLDDIGVPDTVVEIDEWALATVVERPLTDGLAAYLRGLSGRDDDQLHVTPASVALPTRLRDRLGEDDPSSRLEASLIHAGLAWERASLTQGMTMTEWAAFASLSRTRH